MTTTSPFATFPPTIARSKRSQAFHALPLEGTAVEGNDNVTCLAAVLPGSAAHRMTRVDPLSPSEHFELRDAIDPIVLEEAPFWTSPDMVSLEIAAVGFAVPFAIALVPATAIGASVATAELLATPVMALVSEDYKALTDVLNDKTPASTGTILINTAKATATDFLFKKIDGGIGNKISNPVVKDIYDKLPGPGATIYGIWGPKD